MNNAFTESRKGSFYDPPPPKTFAEKWKPRVAQYVNKKALLWSGVILFLWWLLFPAPYNPAYLFKRVFYNPTAICVDGIYSFSANRSGTCSNHSGVKRWLK